MKDTIRAAALDHAKACYPRESCGVVVNGAYVPCRNMAQGTDNFILHPEDYAAAEREGEITAIIHSHPNTSPKPSQADLVACEATGLPWHIVSVPKGEWHDMVPNGYSAPLIGRMWCHGVLDCYSLIRDWYAQERRVELPDFDRVDDWWLNGQNLYVDNFQKAGFTRIIDGPPQHGDVLLMQVKSPVPNHGAIYLDGDIVLHHLYRRLSCREVWAGYYRKHTVYILRYTG